MHMRSVYFILHLCLSLLFIATPILGLSFELNIQAQEKRMCCSDMSDQGKTETMKCHANDKKDKHSCKDKCKDKCHDHAAQVLTHSIHPPTQNTVLEDNDFKHALKISSYYQDLFQQQFILQFWNPPKQV